MVYAFKKFSTRGILTHSTTVLLPHLNPNLQVKKNQQKNQNQTKPNQNLKKTPKQNHHHQQQKIINPE